VPALAPSPSFGASVVPSAASATMKEPTSSSRTPGHGLAKIIVHTARPSQLGRCSHTSADGLWGVFNVPEGTWRIELWGLVGGDEVLLGATTAKVYPDSINIANIFSGYGDGVKYPATCLGDGGGDTDDTDDTDTDT